MTRKILFSLLILGFIGGCQTDPDGVGEDEVVLVLVDGEPITLPMLELVMSARGVGEDDHDGMRELLDELIGMRAIASAAEREGIADDKSVRAERRVRDLEVLNRHYINQFQREYPVTDEDIEAVYQRQVERSGDRQYRIETITYPDQATVLRELGRIDDGEKEYADVRDRAESEGLSVEQPGWIDLSQVPESFAAALEGRSAGEVVTLPLETPQGWRLVQVVDTRALEPPPLAEVRDGIARSLMQQRRQALLDEMREQAEIEPMLPLDESTE
ncbi:peptidyl-prolyl cis-trans isomerase [Wenzhouxiangella sp. AB-CW3]|uniref:peptidylprolyl isomerase n=1 Tax=Wenzhouxiangella sp. AB-CW3 TaxID=2771012 RepID=UPI00168BB8F0|nr:peptidylprolyl isomerase [Wenzhouxiangella sp. AB-CW3]QOC23974.1 peptidyl-prolyl cis-trans isomerase [Wenzhouxiangella sp. AB-CW3]